ncbi:MAG: DUF6056 family protein, partial [Marinobacter sp.]
VSVLSLTLLLVSGVVVATGQLINPLRLKHTFVATIIFAVMCAAGAEVGRALFYVPFTTNYVFGFGLLMLFLATVRLGTEMELSKKVAFLIFPIGLLAGLSNEHTPPVVLGIGAVAIIVHAMGLVDLKLKRLHYHAFFSLLAGYLLLFFAPGQDVRYSNVDKNSGFEELLTNLPVRVWKVLTLLVEHSVPFFIFAVILVALVFLRAWFRREISVAFWPALMLLVSLGMAVTVTASPLIGQRLLFASYAALAVSTAGALFYLSRVPLLFWICGIGAVISSSMYLRQAFDVYSDFHAAYSGHLENVVAAQKAGKTDPVFSPYKFNFRATKEFVRAEYFSTDPGHRLNVHRANIYGFDSVKFSSRW